MALLFFAMLAISNGGYTSFSVAAIASLYQVPLAEANLPNVTVADTMLGAAAEAVALAKGTPAAV